MISRTGPKKARRRRSSASGRQTAEPAAEPLRPRRGFTLIEVVLALTLLVLLTGIAVLNLGALAGSQTLEQGLDRYQTAMRMARAEAANRGRRLRLAFDPETAAMTVFWEPEPLLEPGNFVAFEAGTWPKLIDVDGVEAESCRYVGTSRYRTLDARAVLADGDAEVDRAAITFEPDGSSDSVVIELVATDAPETQRARIELDGLTGAVTGRILTLEEIEGY